MKKFFMYFVSAVLLLSFTSCEKQSLKKVLPLPTPSMNWGESDRTIEKEMKDLGYRLEDAENDEEETYLLFSYEHDRYRVLCSFMYSKYAYYYIYGMRKSEVNDLLEWLDKHYEEQGYKRFEGGQQEYLYRSKDKKSWAFVAFDEEEPIVYWGSMKYASDFYDDILEELH